MKTAARNLCSGLPGRAGRLASRQADWHDSCSLTLIRDIGLLNANITSTQSCVGALVGRTNGGTIHHAYSEDGTIQGSNYTGGLVGGNFASADSNLSIDYTYVRGGTITGSSYVGGLIGTLGVGSIENSHSERRTVVSEGGTVSKVGMVSGTSYVGGLVGNMATVLDSSWSDMETVGRGTSTMYIGGLVGNLGASSTVKNSFALGDVTGHAHVGGLIGYISASAVTLYNVYATGDVYSLESSLTLLSSRMGLGGLVGTATGAGLDVSYVHATGDVGLPVRDADGQIPEGYKAPYNSVGGLFGVFGGNYSDAAHPASLSYAYATGDVNRTPGVNLVGSTGVGGLVGVTGYYNDISSSYSLGDVAGGGQMGGLIGEANIGTSVYDSYAGGAVYWPGANGGTIGGLIGVSGNTSSGVTVENSYWNQDANPGLNGFGAAPTDRPDNTLTGLTGVARNDADIINAIVSGRDPATVITARIEAAAQAAAEAAQARQELIATVASIADDQQASIAQLAAIGEQTFGIPELTPIDLSNAIHDFTPSQTGGPDSADRSYSASVREVTVDGVTFLVDDDEEDRAAR